MNGNSFAKAVQSLVKAKGSLAQRAQALAAELNRILPGMGYRVLPAADKNGPTSSMPRSAARRAFQRARKTLTCPHCDRKFGHPLHLGRHVSAMHKTSGVGRSKAKARKKAQVRRRMKRGANNAA
jgi:uncharacterized C2H2 Zn-finger protein